MTYTYATLDVSPEAYWEIYDKLNEVGYEDRFHREPNEAHATIDMHGIGLVLKEQNKI